MPKGFREDEKQRIAAQLLEQGHHLFSTHGLRKVTVEELATAAGISKGAFYLFYASKEALLMDVLEEAEQRFRQTVLAVVDQPGASPRARLFAILQAAFTLWKTLPLLQAFTRGEYDVLLRRLPAAQLQTHLQSDKAFSVELIARCTRAGIPMQITPEVLDDLLHALFFTSMHEDDFGPVHLTGAMVTLLELVAAYCLGEVTLQLATTLSAPTQAAPAQAGQGARHVPAH